MSVCNRCPGCGSKVSYGEHIIDRLEGQWFYWCAPCWLEEQNRIKEIKRMQRFRFWRRVLQVMNWIENI